VFEAYGSRDYEITEHHIDGKITKVRRHDEERRRLSPGSVGSPITYRFLGRVAPGFKPGLIFLFSRLERTALAKLLALGKGESANSSLLYLNLSPFHHILHKPRGGSQIPQDWTSCAPLWQSWEPLPGYAFAIPSILIKQPCRDRFLNRFLPLAFHSTLIGRRRSPKITFWTGFRNTVVTFRTHRSLSGGLVFNERGN
jgi:hypothetical protein